MPGWQALANLPQVRTLPSAVVSGNYIFCLGGSTDGAPPFAGAVLPIVRAKIDSGGGIGNWVQVGSLEKGKIAPTLHLTEEGYLYMIAGAVQAAINPALIASGKEIRVARIDPDGTLRQDLVAGDGEFDDEGDVPRSVVLLATGKVDGCFYSVSGFQIGALVEFDTETSDFQVGEIVTGQTSGATMIVETLQDSGVTGSLFSQAINSISFQAGEILLGNLGGSATALTGTTFGALNNSDVFKAAIGTGGSVGPWQYHGTLPFNGAPNNSMPVVGDTVYFVNGDALKWSRPEEMAVGSWRSLLLPQEMNAIIFCTPVIVDDVLMIFGGFDAAHGVAIDTVYCIKVTSNGPTGSWYKTEPLPSPRSGPGVVVHNNRVYIVGGSNLAGTSTDTVYTAHIQDGRIAGTKIPVL